MINQSAGRHANKNLCMDDIPTLTNLQVDDQIFTKKGILKTVGELQKGYQKIVFLLASICSAFQSFRFESHLQFAHVLWKKLRQLRQREQERSKNGAMWYMKLIEHCSPRYTVCAQLFLFLHYYNNHYHYHNNQYFFR